MRYVIICSVLLTAFTWCGEPEAGAKPQKSFSFPDRGVSFSISNEWLVTQREGIKTIARFYRTNSPTKTVGSMMMVECGRPIHKSIEESADSLAEGWNGKRAGETTVAGERAIIIRAQNASTELKPVLGIVWRHNDLAYTIMAGNVNGITCEEDMECIRTSWKWIEFDAPLKHVDFNPRPKSLCNGAVLMTFPESMYHIPTDSSSDFHFGIYNQQRLKPDLLIYGRLLTQPIPKDKRSELIMEKPLDPIPGQIDPIVQDPELRRRIKEKFKWQLLDPKSVGMTTNTVLVDDEFAAAMKREKSQKPDVIHVFYGFVPLDEQRSVFLSCTLFSQDDKERAEYEALAVKILKTIGTPKSP